MSKAMDLTGKRFGKLVCLSMLNERTKNGHVQWRCLCDCGNTSTVLANNLTHGNTSSCGCMSSRLKRKTHGHSDTNIYKVWSAMKHRCLNPNDASYCNYGGRGIEVCDEWQSFEPFYEWAMSNGYRQGLTLERIDNDGNYTPTNCAWIPKPQQSSNTRRCKIITYHGETKNLKQWADHLGVSYSLLQSRLKRGWSIERTFTEPKTLDHLCHARLISYRGQTKSVSQWAKELGIGYKALHGRISRGQKIGEIIAITGKPVYVAAERS